MSLAADSAAALREMIAENGCAVKPASGSQFNALAGQVTEGREFVIGSTEYKEDTSLDCIAIDAAFVAEKDHVTVIQASGTRALRVLEKAFNAFGATVHMTLGSPSKGRA